MESVRSSPVMVVEHSTRTIYPAGVDLVTLAV
jgi:hypothetical protein